MVKIGEKAPLFTLKDQDQKDVSLEQFKGKKVLLAFFPFAFSPVCTNEMACFHNSLPQFQNKNVEILGISVDSHWTQKAFAEKSGIHIKLLSDFEKKTANEYGVLKRKDFQKGHIFWLMALA